MRVHARTHARTHTHTHIYRCSSTQKKKENNSGMIPKFQQLVVNSYPPSRYSAKKQKLLSLYINTISP